MKKLVTVILIVASSIFCQEYQMSDYFLTDILRATWTEPITMCDYENCTHGDIRFSLELKYTKYDDYYNSSMDSKDYKTDVYANSSDLPLEGLLDDREYYRSHSWLGIDYGLTNNLEIDIRIPFVILKQNVDRTETGSVIDHYSIHHYNLSDMLFRVRIEPFTKQGYFARFALAVTTKLPTGDDNKTLPAGNGNLEVGVEAYTTLDLEILKLYGKLSYIATKNESKSNSNWALSDISRFDIAARTTIFPLVSIYCQFSGTWMGGFTNYNSNIFSDAELYTFTPGINLDIPSTAFSCELGSNIDIAGKRTLHGNSGFFRIIFQPDL